MRHCLLTQFRPVKQKHEVAHSVGHFAGHLAGRETQRSVSGSSEQNLAPQPFGKSLAPCGTADRQRFCRFNQLTRCQVLNWIQLAQYVAPWPAFLCTTLSLRLPHNLQNETVVPSFWVALYGSVGPTWRQDGGGVGVSGGGDCCLPEEGNMLCPWVCLHVGCYRHVSDLTASSPREE